MSGWRPSRDCSYMHAYIRTYICLLLISLAHPHTHAYTFICTLLSHRASSSSSSLHSISPLRSRKSDCESWLKDKHDSPIILSGCRSIASYSIPFRAGSSCSGCECVHDMCLNKWGFCKEVERYSYKHTYVHTYLSSCS